MTTPHPLGRADRQGGRLLDGDGPRRTPVRPGEWHRRERPGPRKPRGCAQALHDQIDKHLHVMVYGEYAQEPQDQRGPRIAWGRCADMGWTAVYFVNSGTEAIEGAMKLARRATGRT